MGTFSSHLSLWRIARGFSQQELAEKSGIHRPNLIALELGRRDCTLGTLSRLAVALNLTPGKLLDELPRNRASKTLGRHGIDKVARFLIVGEGRLSPSSHNLALHLAPLFTKTLIANGITPKVFGKGRWHRRKYHLESLYPFPTVQAISRRVRKLIPYYAQRGLDP